LRERDAETTLIMTEYEVSWCPGRVPRGQEFVSGLTCCVEYVLDLSNDRRSALFRTTTFNQIFSSGKARTKHTSAVYRRQDEYLVCAAAAISYPIAFDPLTNEVFHDR
jgi:hypothetical protein